jgi:hypothetical protein
MLAKGYSIEQIKQALLKSYPEKLVFDVIAKADAKEKEEKGPAKVKISEKLFGILFKPTKIFYKLKEEDMIHSFNMYAMLLLLVLSLQISALIVIFSFFSDSPLSAPLGLIMGPMVMIYLLGIFLMSLVMPFSIVAYYYLMLKLFRMKKSYDQCYKAIIYSIVQFTIFGIVLSIIGFGLMSFDQLTGGIAFGLGYLVLLVYNLFTQIEGLSILCEVKKWKSAIVVLLPIIVVILLVVFGLVYIKTMFTGFMPTPDIVLQNL